MVTVLVYLLYRLYLNSLIRYINVPIFDAADNIPPASTSPNQEGISPKPSAKRVAQYSLWFIFVFVLYYLIRKRAIDWLKRYNCKIKSQLVEDGLLLVHADALQAAMDTGTALDTIIILVALGYLSISFNL